MHPLKRVTGGNAQLTDVERTVLSWNEDKVRPFTELPQSVQQFLMEADNLKLDGKPDGDKRRR
jgi:hypothetical protein